jgi:hypothetical protein
VSQRLEAGEARDSTSIAGDLAALAARMSEDGFLLLRGVVPAEEAEGLQTELIAILAEEDLVCASTGTDVRPSQPGFPVDVHRDARLFRRLYSLERLHRLPHHPRLLHLAGMHCNEAPVLVHPKPALRVVFPAEPASSTATPPHQDHLGMQGATETYTVWTALSTCDRRSGVIAVARGSHRGGPRGYLPSAGARVATCDATDLDGHWVTADLEPGDVFIFHSLTVHRALPNTSDQVRISIDARYQSAALPICAVSLGDPPHLSWDELYAGWPSGSEDLQRYWEDLTTEVVAFDPSRLASPPAPISPPCG